MIVMSGEKFNLLTAVAFVGRDKQRTAHWLFRCDCGNQVIRRAIAVKNGGTKSCGCLQREAVRATGNARKTHGKRHTAEYNIWSLMKRRCANPKSNCYEYYGGRGIRVCRRWENSFENFFTDMGARPSASHTLERIDFDKDYEPSNCKWATWREQQRNRSSNRVVEFAGKSMTLIEAAERAGLNYHTVHNRLDALGWSLERALSEPPHR